MFVHHPQPVNGVKERAQPTSFDDHHTQAALFWNSLTDTEKDHVVGAFTFELSKVQDAVVVDRVIANLANAVVELPARIAVNLGRPAPPSRNATSEASAALSMDTGDPGPVDGRLVAIIVHPSADVAGCEAIRSALHAYGAVGVAVPLNGDAMDLLPADGPETRVPFVSAQSVQFDAVILPDATYGIDPGLCAFVQEAFRHHKTIAAWGVDANAFLGTLGFGADAAGVVTGDTADGIADSFEAALRLHRHWNR